MTNENKILKSQSILIQTPTPQKIATPINYNIHNKKSCYFLTYPIN
jgi:hypothetical protein